MAIVKDRLAREGAALEIPEHSSTPPDTTQQQNSEAEPPCKRRKLGSWLKEAKPQELSNSSAHSPDALAKGRR